MAYLAIRGSGAVNGVSRLHARVSRHLFEPLFPRWPHAEIPVSHITNGVHMPTWDSAPADDLWTGACGKDRWRGTGEPLECEIRAITDERLWQFRIASSKSLIDYTRVRLARQLAASGSPPEEVETIQKLLNPHILTLGFARRFATYKRTNLLLQDPARLLRLLKNTERPVQLIIAGKAHPQDAQGQALIRQWIQFIRQPEVRPHIVFLSDYDMQLGSQLVQGVDVWINTPRRPWEASGTSGMKVLVNGGINLSELDGWWAEAYSPELGWALGDGKEHGDDPEWDKAEANSLYEILEREVIPEFYQRDAQGIPRQWLARMRESMAQLTPRFSASRTVREYTEKLYLPAAAAVNTRCANNGAIAQQIIAWQQSLEMHWHSLSFGNLQVNSHDNAHHFEVEVFLNGLDPEAIQIELYADALKHHSLGSNGKETEPQREIMLRQPSSSTVAATTIYRASLPATRPATDFTPRAVARFSGVSIPLEESHIRWR